MLVTHFFVLCKFVIIIFFASFGFVFLPITHSITQTPPVAYNKSDNNQGGNMSQTIQNNANASYTLSSDPSTTLTATTNTLNITLENASGLTVTKTASPTTFSAGSIIRYTITITNSSSSYLTGVRVIDNLGGGNLAYVVGSASLSASGTTYPVTPVATSPLTFTLQELGVGASMTLTYNSQVIFNLPSTVSEITNNVEAIGYTSSGTIRGFGNSTITRSGTSTSSFTKSASQTNVYPRQSFSYYLTLTNGSSDTATVSSLTDQLPSNFVLTSVTYRIGSGSTTTLSSSDYTLSSGNLLTIPSSTGTSFTVPANSSTLITLNGYFS